MSQYNNNSPQGIHFNTGPLDYDSHYRLPPSDERSSKLIRYLLAVRVIDSCNTDTHIRMHTHTGTIAITITVTITITITVYYYTDINTYTGG